MIWNDVTGAFLVYEDNTAAASIHLKNFNALADSGYEFYGAEWVE